MSIYSALRRATMVLLLVGLSAGALGAQDLRPIARASLEPGPAVTVGQPLRILIEVLVPSFFTGAPLYPDVELQDALVLFVFTGVNFTERIDGVSWAGQRREYHVYPQRPGPYEIAEIPVGVRYRPPDARSGSTATDTASPPPIRFEATLPAGAEELGYFISALSVELADSFDVRPDTLQVGDAFTRTVSARVHGSLSMVVPPMSGDGVAGLRSYPAAPEVEDIEGFGVEAIEGRRLESVTYVAEVPGDYELPTIELQWWDVTVGEMRRATLPPVRVHVDAAPVQVAEIPFPDDSVSAEASEAESPSSGLEVLRRWGLPAGLLVLLAWGAVTARRRYGPRVRSALEARRRERSESEVAYFGRFKDVARTGDPHATFRALVAWLDRARGPGATVSSFVADSGDEELARMVRLLDSRLYRDEEASDPRSWSSAAFVRAVARARRGIRRRPEQHGDGAGRLRALNPPGVLP